MTVVEALKILGLDRYDEIEIKKSFRRKIAEIHPDVTGISSSSELEKVKRLNLAYTVLKKSKDAEGFVIQEYSYKNEDFFVWDVPENADADCERDIYIHGLDYDEDKSSVIKVATGKYYWDPYLEDFDMFLFSLNKAATGMVDESIFRENMYDEIDEETRMSMRVSVFYRLSGQFIDLDLAFGELFPDEEEYIFKATVTAKGRTREFNSIAALNKDSLFDIKLVENRICVYGDGNVLGFADFENDYGYFLVIPVMENETSRVSVRPVKRRINTKKSPRTAIVTLELYVTK